MISRSNSGAHLFSSSVATLSAASGRDRSGATVDVGTEHQQDSLLVEIVGLRTELRHCVFLAQTQKTELRDFATELASYESQCQRNEVELAAAQGSLYNSELRLQNEADTHRIGCLHKQLAQYQSRHQEAVHEEANLLAQEKIEIDELKFEIQAQETAMAGGLQARAHPMLLQLQKEQSLSRVPIQEADQAWRQKRDELGAALEQKYCREKCLADEHCSLKTEYEAARSRWSTAEVEGSALAERLQAMDKERTLFLKEACACEETEELHLAKSTSQASDVECLLAEESAARHTDRWIHVEGLKQKRLVVESEVEEYRSCYKAEVQQRIAEAKSESQEHDISQQLLAEEQLEACHDSYQEQLQKFQVCFSKEMDSALAWLADKNKAWRNEESELKHGISSLEAALEASELNYMHAKQEAGRLSVDSQTLLSTEITRLRNDLLEQDMEVMAVQERAQNCRADWEREHGRLLDELRAAEGTGHSHHPCDGSKPPYSRAHGAGQGVSASDILEDDPIFLCSKIEQRAEELQQMRAALAVAEERLGHLSAQEAQLPEIEAEVAALSQGIAQLEAELCRISCERARLMDSNNRLRAALRSSAPNGGMANTAQGHAQGIGSAGTSQAGSVLRRPQTDKQQIVTLEAAIQKMKMHNRALGAELARATSGVRQSSMRSHSSIDLAVGTRAAAAAARACSASARTPRCTADRATENQRTVRHGGASRDR